MTNLLTEGALAIIMDGGEYVQPVVQVLSIKKMGSASGQPEKERYRAFLSDGKYSVSFAMMTAAVYAKAGEQGLVKFSVIKILRFMTSVIDNTQGKDSRVLLILDFEVLKEGSEVGKKLGDPVQYQKPMINRTSDTASGVKAGPSTSNGDSGPVAKMPRLGSSTSGSGNLSLAGDITHPIASLSPYHNKWIIKARVMNKSEIRKWENSRGSGQLFSMDLVDESGEIRLTGFREQVDKFYNLVQEDKVYYISKCQLKAANKQFSSLKNDYEMTMTSETVIEECHDDDMSALQTHFKFISINTISNLEANTTVDVIGVAKATSDLQTFQARSTGRELKKREVQLVDQSNSTITLTLWGTQAENFDGSGNPVIALKGARIGEFGGGKTLSTISGTMMKINPEISECYKLKGWFESEGANQNTNDLSAKTVLGGSFNTPWMCFKEVTDNLVGSNDPVRGDYYQAKATVLLLKSENCVYKACPTAECNKKVIDNNDGTYRCEKCNQSFENFKYRLLCNMNVGDWSGNQWVSLFNDEAEKVVGMNSQQAGELYDNDRTKFMETLEEAHFKEFILKCRAKMENYNDEQRLKTVAVRADPINYEEYNTYLIDNIKKLTSID